MCKLTTLCAVGLMVLVAAQDVRFTPARFRNGRVPPIPVTAIGGGEVLVELDVSSDGLVTRATPLRTTPPFTDFVLTTVREWQFFPARDVVDPDRARAGEPTSRVAVPSKVLVAAVFRPPAVLGPTLGEAPKDISSGTDAIAFPLATIAPPFPPRAFGGGVVLLEVHVDAAGAVGDVGVLASVPPFDDPATQTVSQWHFRPAQLHGAPVATLVYVVFGFRVPVGTSEYTRPVLPALIRAE